MPEIWARQAVCDGPSVAFAQGRNRFRGPSYFNTDFAVMKNTKIPGWENAELGIGFQFFNLFNHPNFGFPDTASSDSTFGQIFNLEQPPTSIVGSGIGGDAAPTDDSVESSTTILIDGGAGNGQTPPDW